jgi:hypothetical protein
MHESFLSHAWWSQTVSCCVYQILWTVTNHIRNITDYTTTIICINLRFLPPSGFCLYAAGKPWTLRRQHECKRISENHCRVSGYNLPYATCATGSGRGKVKEGENVFCPSSYVHNCPMYSNLLFIRCLLCSLMGIKVLVIFWQNVHWFYRKFIRELFTLCK